MLKAKLENKRLWADWELKRELEQITQEILRRFESDAIAVGNLEIIREPDKNKKKKITEYRSINSATENEFWYSENKIERYKAFRSVTGFSLELTRRFANALGYKIKSFRGFEDY